MASETNETREKSLNFLEEIIEESIAKGETRVQTCFRPNPTDTSTSATPRASASTSDWPRSTAESATSVSTTRTPSRRMSSMSIRSARHPLARVRLGSGALCVGLLRPALYEWAIVLIKKGLAYVDDQTQEQIHENRGTVSVPGTPRRGATGPSRRTSTSSSA